MAQTLETRLYNTLKRNPNPQTVQELIDQRVDCNLSHFDSLSRTFISPIQLAAKTDRYNSLQLLYEHRNAPTKIQLEKHLTFYINHHDRSQQETNKTLFDYTVSRLLYSRITNYHRIVFNTVIAGLHDFDNAEHRGQSLSEGSQTKIILQLRIYTLFRKIIDMKIDSNNDMIEVIENELLHNLETYYFLVSIKHIPVIRSKPNSLLIKCYQSIAKNLIKKIEQLAINQEYTIPTGWHEHAVCVSFRRINEAYIIIRIDNPTTVASPQNVHEIVFSTDNLNVIKPKILGQLNVNNLEANLDYFVSLIDSVKRDLRRAEGISLIYNLKKQIRHLDETQVDVPCFLEQADANCFFKCFEPGFWIRFGENHQRLYHHLLLLEKNNANLFASRCVEEHQHNFNDLFDQFTSFAEEEDMTNLPVEERVRLQNKLKMRYKQHYQYLLGNTNIEHCHPLDDKYVPLRFENKNAPIELKNLFINSRVLMLGEAGCGKTTVCQYITYSWAIGKKLWRNQFDWLFYIKMRNLNKEHYPEPNAYSLVDIIKRECFGERNRSVSNKQKLPDEFEKSSNILWILDGCDERTIPEYLLSIERELLAKPHLLLTSRYEMDDLRYDAKIHVQNFTDQNIETYIQNYFSFTRRTTGQQCWSRISSSEQLLQTARIPACLEIICSLWDNGKEKLDPGIKKGELYQKMCEYLLRQYLLKFYRLCNSALVERDIYQEPNAVVFAHLERLAFEATGLHRLTISGHEITNVAGSHSQFPSVFQTILLIPSTRDSSSQLLESVYYFVHRSFQEYLCARYMIRVLKSSSSNEEKREVYEFITNEKYNRHVKEIFRLFLESESSSLCIDQFWSVVDSEPRDLVGLRHCSRIAHWFPEGNCGFPLEEQNTIGERTTDIILEWIKNTVRRPHDIGNTYIFETFVSATGYECWLEAWEKDLSIKDPSKRRYFLPDVWSSENINVLKDIYKDISKDVNELHRLVTVGPNVISLRRLKLESNLFALYTVDHQIEASEFLKKAQEKAMNRESINTLAEFQTLLQNYASFANLNRQLGARGSITWRLKIAPSALEGIDHKMLHLLLQLSQEHALFYRYLKLPLIPFLNLYANQNDLNDEILSLIVSITMSSDCILTAPPNQTRSIRVYEKDIIKDIEMDEHQRTRLLSAFDQARDDYGYSSFFRCNE